MSTHISAGGVFDERLHCWRLLIETYDTDANTRSGHLDKKRYDSKLNVDLAAQLFIQSINAQAQAAELKLSQNGDLSHDQTLDETPNEGDTFGKDSEGE